MKVNCPVEGFIVIVPLPGFGCPQTKVPPVAFISFVCAFPETGVFCIVLVASLTAVGQLLMAIFILDAEVQLLVVPTTE